jgi:hypothetical protein
LEGFSFVVAVYLEHMLLNVLPEFFTHFILYNFWVISTRFALVVN